MQVLKQIMIEYVVAHQLTYRASCTVPAKYHVVQCHTAMFV